MTIGIFILTTVYDIYVLLFILFCIFYSCRQLSEIFAMQHRYAANFRLRKYGMCVCVKRFIFMYCLYKDTS
jgi:hypothetical protein